MNFHTARVLGSYRRRFGIAAGLIAVALYAAIVLASGTTADLVLGQPNPTSTAPGYGGAQGLRQPYGVAIDTSATPNRLYVVDTYNNRVLGWNDVATLTNGEAADLVIGQLDFTSHAANTGGESASTLSSPLGAAVDGSGNLYVRIRATAGCWSTQIRLRRVREYSRAWAVRPIWSLARPGASRRKVAIKAASVPPACVIQRESRWTARATSGWRMIRTDGCWSTTPR